VTSTWTSTSFSTIFSFSTNLGNDLLDFDLLLDLDTG